MDAMALVPIRIAIRPIREKSAFKCLIVRGPIDVYVNDNMRPQMNVAKNIWKCIDYPRPSFTHNKDVNYVVDC